MKKFVAILLSLALLLGCASALAEKTHVGTVSVNGAFEIRCVLPEGYEVNSEEMENGGLLTLVTTEDTDKPLMIMSIAFNDLYAEVKRLNDLDDEALALIEATFTDEYQAEISYMETAYGTKLMVVKVPDAEEGFVDIYTIYQGYEIEFVLVNGSTGGALTAEQIQSAVDFLSDVDFVEI